MCRMQVIESLGCRSLLRPKREILKRFPALRFGWGWQPGRGGSVPVSAKLEAGLVCRMQVIESLGCRSLLRPKREILKRFPALRFGSGWQPGRGSRVHVRAGKAFLMRVTVSEAGHRV